MEIAQIIVTVTCLIELGLGLALLYRIQNPPPDPQYPHFRADSEKFYRSQQHADGTWEIR